MLSLALAIAGLGCVWILSRVYYEPLTAACLRVVRLCVGLRRRSVQIDGLRMVYLEGGRGQPLILLHGLGADKDNFLAVAGILRRRFRVIIPDLPGFGESDKPDAASYRVTVQVARLRSFATALGIERFHLGGNSMGGLIAGAYVVTRPQDVQSLWLLAPAGVKGAATSELMSAIAGNAAQLPIFGRTVADMRRLLAFASHRPPWLPYFVLATMAAQQRRNSRLYRRIVDEMLEGPWLDELLAVRPATPSLIVWGNRDRALDVSGAPLLHALLPRSRMIIMRDIGHVPMIEAPRRSAADFLAFQAALDSHQAL